MSLGILGVPQIDLVLDALISSAVLEFFQREKDSKRLSVGVGGIEHDEGESELVPQLGGEIVFTLGCAKEEAC